MSPNVETVGVSPKVPVQAVVTVAVSALAFFGIDLSPEVSGALGVVVGFIAGVAAPAASVRPKR
jgi:hypothetical protein